MDTFNEYSAKYFSPDQTRNIQSADYNTVDQYIKAIQADGKELAHGMDGVVFVGKDKKARERVIKVFRANSSWEPSIKFLKYCMNTKAHEQNSLFPQVFNVRQFNDGWGVELEFLEMDPLAVNGFFKVKDLRLMLRYIYRMAVLGHVDPNDRYNFGDKAVFAKAKEFIDNDTKLVQYIIDYMKKIHQLFGEDVSDNLDLHPRNIAFRGRHNIVFFDPLH